MPSNRNIQFQNSDHDLSTTVRQWLQTGHDVVVATVSSTWGSAPVPNGGQMAIRNDGLFSGSVSGGCIENEIIVRAGDILKSGRPEVLRFGVSDHAALELGLPCGGEIEVFVEAFRTSSEPDIAVFDAICAARHSRRRLSVETRLENGAHRIIAQSVTTAGEPGGSGNAVCRFVGVEDERCFLREVTPPPRIVIIGAVHIAQVLVDLATNIGMEAVIIDPREAYTSAERFPQGPVICAWPDVALDEIGLDQSSALVTLAHVPDIDDAALLNAARSDAFYVGALGSRRNHAKRLDRLRAAGLTEGQLARIEGPAGVDIGASGPAEIALSILSGVVLAYRGRKHQPISERQRAVEESSTGP